MKHSLETYNLFGIIPIIYKEKFNKKTSWKLFKFIPILTIKELENKITFKIFGIPVIKKESKNYSSTWTYRLMRFLSAIPSKRNVVLLVDNIFEKNINIADNFTLFEYLYNSPLKIFKPYYILKKHSQYYKELKAKYKDSIIGVSDEMTPCMKLKLLSLIPKVKYVCDSFLSIDFLNLNFSKLIKKSPNIFSIFTQHGITYFKPDCITQDSYSFNKFDYIVVSNDAEKEIFIKNGKFPQSRIIKNGLFRWDNIEDLSKKSEEKTIFIYFTRRSYINRIKNIKSSKYIKTIEGIINNSELQDILTKHNIKIKLGLHHSMVSKLDINTDNKNTTIVSEDEIRNVKNESSLLITDYSSMCFEFFIQNKPVIFYNINDITDCKLYNRRGDEVNPYEGKEQELFNIITNKQDLIKLITKYIDNNFECEEEIMQKESKFFYYRNDFCKRFESFMIEHMNDKK